MRKKTIQNMCANPNISLRLGASKLMTLDQLVMLAIDVFHPHLKTQVCSVLVFFIRKGQIIDHDLKKVITKET